MNERARGLEIRFRWRITEPEPELDVLADPHVKQGLRQYAAPA